MTRTRVEGLVILLVALAYLWEAHNVPEFYQIPGVPGPTTFPYLLGLVFAVCGAVAADLAEGPRGRSSKAKRRKRRRGIPPRRPATGPGTCSAASPREWHLVAMWAVVLAYLWFMPDLGFPLATFLLLVTVLLAARRDALARRPRPRAGLDRGHLRDLQGAG